MRKLVYLNTFLAIVLVIGIVAASKRSQIYQQYSAETENADGALHGPVVASARLSVPVAQAAYADSTQSASSFVPTYVTANIGHVPVLMYHHVGDLPVPSPGSKEVIDAVRRDLTVSTLDFAHEMDVLSANGYHSITAEQLYEAATGKGSILPSKPILITFDDGYADVFENAVPVLVAHGFIGSFGIITGFRGPDYATWNQVKAARDLGMEIVAHSYGHIDFSASKYSYGERLQQIVRSKEDLQNLAGVSTNIFIYPYGKYNLQTEQILQNSGFVMSFTTAYQADFVNKGDNLLELPRVRVHGNETILKFKQSLGIKS